MCKLYDICSLQSDDREPIEVQYANQSLSSEEVSIQNIRDNNSKL
jgi:hypothetical protein